MPEKIIAPLGDKQITIETGDSPNRRRPSSSNSRNHRPRRRRRATKAKEGQDFFSADGGLSGEGRRRREIPGRLLQTRRTPTEKEILTSRIIIAPIRRLCSPKAGTTRSRCQSIPLSADGENDPDMLAVLGASTAPHGQRYPWAGPLGAPASAAVNGQFVANPTHAQMADSDLDLSYVGNDTELVMFEGSAKEILEADFNAALKFAQNAIQPMIQAQKELAARVGKEEARHHTQHRSGRDPQ